MTAAFQFLAQAAAQPTADQVTKAAAQLTEAAKTLTASADKLATATKSTATQVPVLSADVFALILVCGIALITIVAMGLIYRHVKASANWSIADALSEDFPVGPLVRDGTGAPILGKDNLIQHENMMKASSSRLIALLGAVSILMLYIGVGLSVLMQFSAKGTVPAGTKEVSQFFLWGMVLFAPYVVNKFSGIFGWLK